MEAFSAQWKNQEKQKKEKMKYLHSDSVLGAMLSIVLFASGCVTNVDPEIKYGLSDKDLSTMGQSLGYEVEPLGMSDYKFKKHGVSFNVWAHANLGSTDVLRADAPIRMSHKRADGSSLIRTFDMTSGLTEEQLTEYFEGFVTEINQ